MSMTLTDRVRAMVARLGPENDEAEFQAQMNELLRLLGRWRSQLLANTYIALQGPYIFQGPFAGMQYVTSPTEGSLIARLLGTYESELYPYIRQIAEKGLDEIIVIGCAEGYYAVGLARLYPHVKVYAYDNDPAARSSCEQLAAANAVQGRLLVRGEFRQQDFEAHKGRRVLVMVDIEGAEDDILQPILSPCLSSMSLIVETHDPLCPGVLLRLTGRFQSTHEITRVDQQPKQCVLPPWLQSLPHLDQLLSVWEWRGQPTPWLVMIPRIQPCL
jgi:hypothetical protein